MIKINNSKINKAISKKFTNKIHQNLKKRIIQFNLIMEILIVIAKEAEEDQKAQKTKKL